MTGVVESLRARHRELNSLAASLARAVQAGDWTGYRGGVASLRERLLSLIEYEDEDLLPALERTANRAPIAPLRAEHAALRALADELAAASPAHDPEGCRAELDRLAELLHKHDRSSAAAFDTPGLHMLAGPPAGRGERTQAIDLRELEPPEPMLRILDALERDPGQGLAVVLRHEPFPLYELLHARNRRFHGETRADGAFELVIEAIAK